MILIYLAAGRGSRLPKEFRNNPKCLVKVKNKTLFERNKEFFNFFKKKIIITGYKKNKIQKLAKKMNFKIIHNKYYIKTNMVFSMFLASKQITEDVVVCYGDIIFNKEIIKILRTNKNILPIYVNWFKYWNKRMTYKKILNDAENLKIHKGKVTQIGGKIVNQLPKYQYMGIMKLNKKTFIKLSKFFKSQNPKIDMTSFLNECINKRKLKLNIKKYKSFWHEIDEKKDIIIAESSRELK